MKLISKIALIAIVIGGAIFFSNDRNRAYFGSRGNIEEGKKFGIKIGDSRVNVISHLEKSNFENITSDQPLNSNPQECHFIVYADDIKVDVFWDASWRRGIICVASQDGIVVRMSWDYAFYP